MPSKRNDNLGSIQYVNLVGVELEGAWQRFDEDGETLRTRAPRGWKEDGSVDVYTHEDSFGNFGWAGEIASHPIQPKPQVLGQWIKRNYPDKVNNSCGLHVHVSLINNNDYAKLVTKSFCDWMNNALSDFGKAFKLPRSHALWGRIEGGQSFCKREFMGEDQINFMDSDRYTQVNYCAFHRHGTVEIRTLPAFRDAHVAVGAVYSVIRAVETYLQYEDELIAVGKSKFLPEIIRECEVDTTPPEPVSESIELGGGLVEHVSEVIPIDQVDLLIDMEMPEMGSTDFDDYEDNSDPQTLRYTVGAVTSSWETLINESETVSDFFETPEI